MRPDRIAVPAPGDSAATELMAFLAAATGNARLSAARSPVLEQVRARLSETGVTSLGDYLALLKDRARGNRELDALIGRLTVGETFFFRQGEQFDAFRQVVLPAALARKARTRELRIWSAGCANGAEPYSIAILLYTVLGDDLGGWRVTIVGSDINRAFLSEAEAGVYSPWSLRGVDQRQLDGFFAKTAQGWRLRDRYRERVQFVQHNLVRDDVPSFVRHIHSFDIVFCRNVMLYFDDESNRIAAGHLAAVLADDGYLFVAPTDINPHLEAAFTSEGAAGIVLYRKRTAPSNPAHRARSRPASPKPLPGVHPLRGRTQRGVPASPRRVPRAVSTAPSPAVRSDITAIVALADRGDLAEAGRRAQALLAAEPMNAAAHYYSALVARASGQTVDAEASLRRAVYLDRAFALAHYHLALCLAEDGETGAASKAFANVVDLLATARDETPQQPGGEITAGALRALAAQALQRLGH